MKYRSVSIAIVGIWIICAITILARDDVSPMALLVYALVNTVFLSLIGFRSALHPNNNI